MADSNFLPLDSTGGVSTHIASGRSNQFQPLTSSGYEINHASQVNALLPMLVVPTDGQHMGADNIADGSGQDGLGQILPALTQPKATWGWKMIKAQLQPLRFSGSMTVPRLARQYNALLPALTGTADALVGNMAESSGSFQLLVGTAWGGASMIATLPALKGSASTKAFDKAEAVMVLPALKGSASASLYSYAAFGFGKFPALRGMDYGFAQLMVLPRLHGTARMTNAAPFTTLAWAYNLKRNAMTSFTNFGYRAIVRFQNKYYAIGLNGGLYLLGGDLDDKTLTGDIVDQPIGWNFETGYDDNDSAALKGLLGVYVDGVIEKGAELTVVTDKRARYTYTLHSGSGVADYRTHRVAVGRGVRSRNVGIAMSNPQGGFVEIDQIAPDYVISPRSI